MPITKKSLSNLKPAKKGEKRNPEGARTHKTYQMKKLTNLELQDIINAVLNKNKKELKSIIDDPEASALKVGVATSIAKAISRGDWKTIEAIIERIVGKVTVKIDHTTQGEKLENNVSINILKDSTAFDELLKLDEKISKSK
jgi:hypothetical protein